MATTEPTQERLAIISTSEYGYDYDRKAITLRLSVRISETKGADLVLASADAVDMFEAMRLRDIRQLSGKPVWVNVDPEEILITYRRAWTG